MALHDSWQGLKASVVLTRAPCELTRQYLISQKSPRAGQGSMWAGRSDGTEPRHDRYANAGGSGGVSCRSSCGSFFLSPFGRPVWIRPCPPSEALRRKNSAAEIPLTLALKYLNASWAHPAV